MGRPWDRISRANSRLFGKSDDLDVSAARPAPQEIPVGGPQRETVRLAVELRIAVRFDTAADVLSSRTLNVSRGGAFIRTRDPRPCGTRVQIRLTIGDRNLELSGHVVRSVSTDDPSGLHPGMGVKFDDLAPDVEAALDQLVARKD